MPQSPELGRRRRSIVLPNASIGPSLRTSRTLWPRPAARQIKRTRTPFTWITKRPLSQRLTISSFSNQSIEWPRGPASKAGRSAQRAGRSICMMCSLPNKLETITEVVDDPATVDLLSEADALPQRDRMLLKYVTGRLVAASGLALAATLAVFLIAHAVPAHPVLEMLGDRAASNPETVAQFRAHWGFDRPLWQQYLIFLQSLLHGDLG